MCWGRINGVFVYRKMERVTTSIRSPILQAIKATGHSGLYLCLDVFKKVVGITALLISLWFGPFWICFAFLCASFIGLMINLIPCKRLFDYSLFELIQDIFPCLFISLIMGVIVYSLKFVIAHTIILLFTQIIIGIVAYILISFISKNETFRYVITVIKKKSRNIRQKHENK